MQLYTYFRSSAAYRVRIALALKGLAYEAIPVHLLQDGGQQHAPAYAALNPAELVPTLVDEGHALTQSMAIIEYLEETHPTPALLPAEPLARAQVRALAQAIACDMHPLNNLRVMQHLERTFAADETAKAAWMAHWMSVGFTAVEKMLERSAALAATLGAAATGDFCYGTTPTLADCCLIPQVFNARRFGVPLDAFPRIVRIDAACAGVGAFVQALGPVPPA